MMNVTDLGLERMRERELPGSELAEVSFRLESVGSETQEHSRREHKGLKHYGVLIK